MSNLAKSIVSEATEIMEKVAEQPTNQLSATAVEEAKPQLKAAITPAVEAMVAHATNTESSIWQRRSFWSFLVSIVVGLAGPWIMENAPGIDLSPATQEAVATWMQQGALAVGGYLAIRAGIAKKPLGQGGVP